MSRFKVKLKNNLNKGVIDENPLYILHNGDKCKAHEGPVEFVQVEMKQRLAQ